MVIAKKRADNEAEQEHHLEGHAGIFNNRCHIDWAFFSNDERKWAWGIKCLSLTGMKLACNILRLDILAYHISETSLKIQYFLD